MKTTNYTPQEGTLSANIHPNIRTQKKRTSYLDRHTPLHSIIRNYHRLVFITKIFTDT